MSKNMTSIPGPEKAMASSPDGRLVAAYATTTDRASQTDSQDRAAIVVNDQKGVIGVVVCDGVGSQPDSGEIADLVVGKTTEFVSNRGLSGWDELSSKVNSNLDRDLDGACTQIVVALDNEGRVRFSFLGDGALFEVRMRELMPGHYWPAFSEMALAQSLSTPGGWALTGYLPAPSGTDPDPVIGSRSRQLRPEPQLWLAVTDGVSSDQERPLSIPTPEGSRWQETSQVLTRLLDQLARNWQELISPETKDPDRILAECLARELDNCGQQGLLKDDTTAAAVLYRPDPNTEKR